MRVSVNLASRPFVEIRPLLARLRVSIAALALVALALGFWLHSLSARAAIARARLDAATNDTYAVQQRRAANEARMRQPQNRAVLERSQFLNATFARKSFSWTAVMMDLERVLPTGVVVTSIEPQVSKEGEVTIRLRVSGDRDRARFLRPLTRAALAESLGVHESTLSRATANKFVRIGTGETVPFATFFTPALRVQSMIDEILAVENPASPLSDERIRILLEERGVSVARRTVAKYRTRGRMLSSRDRRGA